MRLSFAPLAAPVDFGFNVGLAGFEKSRPYGK
jgi:hypothetical protein